MSDHPATPSPDEGVIERAEALLQSRAWNPPPLSWAPVVRDLLAALREAQEALKRTAIQLGRSEQSRNKDKSALSALQALVRQVEQSLRGYDDGALPCAVVRHLLELADTLAQGISEGETTARKEHESRLGSG